MERDIKKIISQMTLEEKASLCSGLDLWHTKPIERLGIPSIMMTDGPHGLRKQDEKVDRPGLNTSIPATCFPTASCLACSKVKNTTIGDLMEDPIGSEIFKQILEQLNTTVNS